MSRVIDVKRRFEGGKHRVTVRRHVMEPVDDTAVDPSGEYYTRSEHHMVERDEEVLETTDPDHADLVARDLRTQHGL